MSKYTDNEKRVSILRRTAKEVKQYKVAKKILITASILLSILLGALYVVATLYKQTGSFTVSLNKYEMNRYGLTLSEHQNMSYQSSHLNTEIDELITNIAEESIPEDVDVSDGTKDGAHNGANYIAYTFYLKNAGDVAVSYEYGVMMSNITNDLDSAIRLRLYVDGEATTYAKAKLDGTPEGNMTPFPNSAQMAVGRMDGFQPDAVTRFTVVIWIEGNDPDCHDGLIGGQMKIDMTMSIVH